MKRFWSILPLILLLVTTLLVSCSNQSASTPPPTYTAEKIEQLQTFLPEIKETRERMSELSQDIQSRNWSDTQSLIHGPFGQLRHDLSYTTRNLLPSDQKKARNLAKDLFFHFEKIDEAAKEDRYSQAVTQFNEAIEDFDAFLDLIPEPKLDQTA